MFRKIHERTAEYNVLLELRSKIRLERCRMTGITTVVYTALIVFGIIGLTEVAFAWYDIHGRDKTDDEIQEQWCSENIKR